MQMSRLKRTLRYCLILFAVLVPLYYIVYTLFWSEVPTGEAFKTSLMYGAINVVFLGALHYFYASAPKEDAGD